MYDPEHVLVYEPPELQEDMSYEEFPVMILAREVRKLRNREIPYVKDEPRQRQACGFFPALPRLDHLGHLPRSPRDPRAPPPALPVAAAAARARWSLPGRARPRLDRSSLLKPPPLGAHPRHSSGLWAPPAVVPDLPGRRRGRSSRGTRAQLVRDLACSTVAAALLAAICGEHLAPSSSAPTLGNSVRSALSAPRPRPNRRVVAGCDTLLARAHLPVPPEAGRSKPAPAKPEIGLFLILSGRLRSAVSAVLLRLSLFGCCLVFTRVVPAIRGCSDASGREHGDRWSVLITVLTSLWINEVRLVLFGAFFPIYALFAEPSGPVDDRVQLGDRCDTSIGGYFDPKSVQCDLFWLVGLCGLWVETTHRLSRHVFRSG
uniref:Uncharacterized protein n=1 Tax=Ananas comosus var. bracteatus TaxID=296719 RepID=A0A6V7QBY9_ANACO|nr:unnamed protein product [Ananas comosus var. bracteatus]